MEWGAFGVGVTVAGLLGVVILLLLLFNIRRRRQQHGRSQHDTDSERSENSPISAKQSMLQPQHIYVMRHGEREDDVNAAWTAAAARPFDPPISKAGVGAAHYVGGKLSSADIQVVVASPFLRCLQTAVAVCDGMGHPGRIEVDNGLSEVQNPNVIKGADPLQPVVLPHSTLASMFPGRLADEPSPIPMPEWGEERGIGGDAYVRYIATMARLAEKHWPYNLLLVTHGDAVAACVGNLLSPGAMVYRTDYCCYAHFTQTAGTWELCPEQSQGIEWIAD